MRILSSTDCALIDSPIGQMVVETNGKAVTLVEFLKDGETVEVTEHQSPVLKLCIEELVSYFAGTLKNFSVPVEPIGTDFRIKCWAELQKIPYGEAISYQELAVRIGNPKAIRAVGGANHHNPISIIIPCHRVIGKSGKLVGYGGGLWRKEWLLEMEKGATC